MYFPFLLTLTFNAQVSFLEQYQWKGLWNNDNNDDDDDDDVNENDDNDDDDDGADDADDNKK